MKLKARLLIPALAIAALLLVATVGVVAAQTATTTPNPTPTPTQEKPRDQVLDRAAQILGVDKDKLQDALKQAITETRRERQDQALKHRLDKMVENERLTQADADAIYAWFQSRPDAAVGLVGQMMGQKAHPKPGVGMHGKSGPHWPQPAPQTQAPTSF